MEQMDLDFDPPIRHNEWYHGTRGFENDHPGWHLCKVFSDGDSWRSISQVKEIVNYLYERVDNCERHCRWTYGSNYFMVKFRYERDAVLFALKF